MSTCAVTTRRDSELRALPRNLADLRSQAACVRALLDEVERVVPAGAAAGAAGAQLVEELARLGCRFLEAAGALTGVGDAAE
jgi:hypothetical protein